MTSSEEYYMRMLKRYFLNIKEACENGEIDERAYIKGVAECGLFIIKENFEKSIYGE